jgi:hypothetical protein
MPLSEEPEFLARLALWKISDYSTNESILQNVPQNNSLNNTSTSIPGKTSRNHHANNSKRSTNDSKHREHKPNNISTSILRKTFQNHDVNSWNRFSNDTTPQISKFNNTSTSVPRQPIQFLESNNRARVTNFFSLPRDLRHETLQFNYDNFFYSSSYQKSLYGSWNVMKWTKNLRGVDKRLTEDLDFTEEIEYESWIQLNETYLKECVLPGWVDEYKVLRKKLFKLGRR